MCPGCDTDQPPTLLGGLGRLLWVRCRACGINFNIHPDDMLDSDDEDQ